MSVKRKVKKFKSSSEFFQIVYGNAVDGVISIWTKQDKNTKFFTGAKWGQALRFAISIWHRLAVMVILNQLTDREASQYH